VRFLRSAPRFLRLVPRCCWRLRFLCLERLARRALPRLLLLLVPSLARACPAVIVVAPRPSCVPLVLA